MNIISTDDGVLIHPLCGEEDILGAFFNKTSAIYGLTGSGKSYGAKSIISAIGTVTPKAIFYSKTEKQNKAYSTDNPSPIVYHSFNLNHLKQVLKYQEALVSRWDMSNCNLNNLTQLARKYNILYQNYFQELEQVENLEERDYLKCKYLVDALYEKMPNDEDENIFRFMKINPSILVIIDDFAAEVAGYCRKADSKEFLNSLGYNARHSQMTTIYLLQDTNAINPTGRRNMQTIVFSSPSEARVYLTTRNNGLSPEDMKEAVSVTKKLEELGGYRNLVYCRDGTYKYKWNYIIGNGEDKCRVCSYPLQEYCKRVSNDQTFVSIEN